MPAASCAAPLPGPVLYMAIHMCVYIYIYTHTHTHFFAPLLRPAPPGARAPGRHAACVVPGSAWHPRGHRARTCPSRVVSEAEMLQLLNPIGEFPFTSIDPNLWFYTSVTLRPCLALCLHSLEFFKAKPSVFPPISSCRER